ncbi:hypothetical protein GCM10010862_10550 [Devosia nitrariae]|uniref:Uncharacterized protein n=1 Tax=Devosia nitrariae TaxID=2071872 RepID=A0ABQ5W1P3_9HYPH|nr:hypothetical protein GCM10010862_10550 [Devosia nitrariae]
MGVGALEATQIGAVAETSAGDEETHGTPGLLGDSGGNSGHDEGRRGGTNKQWFHETLPFGPEWA